MRPLVVLVSFVTRYLCLPVLYDSSSQMPQSQGPQTAKQRQVTDMGTERTTRPVLFPNPAVNDG